MNCNIGKAGYGCKSDRTRDTVKCEGYPEICIVLKVVLDLNS